MIIYKPKIEKRNGKIRIFSKITFQTKNQFPDCLWFEVSEKYENYISDSSNPFVASLFLLAMVLNENIEVKGKLSPKLLSGIKKYQAIYQSWLSNKYTVININCSNLKASKINNNKGVLATFTGGVDSFYTLWSNIPKNQPDKAKQITHGLFVHGFETNVNDVENFTTMQKPLEKMLGDIDIKLFSVRTNIREFTNKKIGWDFAYGTSTVAIAFIFEPVISTFYIASSYTHGQIHPYGSHPETNPLLSSESLKVVHHGLDKTRVEKTLTISDWNKTYDNLRVCFWLQTDGLNNCCRCSKCIRTMLPLEISGTLSRYKTFPLSLTRKTIRKSLFLSEGDRIFIREIIEYAEKNNRKDIVLDLHIALLRSWAPSLLVTIINKNKSLKKISEWLGNKMYASK